MPISEARMLQEIRNALARAVDAVSWGQIGINFEHSKIHDGDSFTAHYESVAPLPTNAGEETAIGFLTPAAAIGRVHMIIDVRADDESVWELREAPTVVLNQGTVLTPLNRFRDSANRSVMLDLETNAANAVSQFTVAEAVAADLSGGTILHSETIAIAAGPPFGSIMNAESRGQREFILMADTEYVIIVTSSTANVTVHEITLNWYELIHKNE